jgi:lipopolysaccharide biosynthesis regulator YciM
MLELVFLLLPIAALSGWYAGYKKTSKQTPHSSSILHRNYLVGLNYLINEQPDKAIDIFIKLLEVDSETIETHFALGNLFRRRGEVDRAIRIHQNLIARPQLDHRLRTQAISELGQDYMHAGVLDRAEGIFLELSELNNSSVAISSLQYLLNIYEREKDWQKAIEVAQRMAGSSSQSMSSIIAQYYCELAEQEFSLGKNDQAEHCLKNALAIDKLCVRASLLLAHIKMQTEQFKAAIHHFKHAKIQDPNFISEIIEPLSICYLQINAERTLINFLQSCLNEYPRVSVILSLADYLKNAKGNKAAIEFLAEQIRQHPSLRGLERLIELYIESSVGDAKDKISILHQLVNQLLKNKPVYRCSQCGFSSKILYWHCPSCKTWNNIKPIHGLEGD